MKEVEFLKYILEGIMTDPEDIKIEKKDDELGTLLTLQVNKEDMGIIIGKKGATIQSLRSIMRILGTKLDKKLNLKVVE